MNSRLPYLFLAALFLFTASSKAQTRALDSLCDEAEMTHPISPSLDICGTITDQQNKEVIPFAVVEVTNYRNEVIGSGHTDFDGKYRIHLDRKQILGHPVNIRVTYIGYQSARVTKILVGQNPTIYVNAALKVSHAIDFGCYFFACPRLVDDFGVSSSITREQWNHMAK